MSEKMREALELADAALSGANMNMTVVRRKIAAALAQPEQRIEVEAKFSGFGNGESAQPEQRGEVGYLPRQPPEAYVAWLAREMPDGTVISDSEWWAKATWSAFRRWINAAPPATAVPVVPDEMPLPEASTGCAGEDMRLLGKAMGWNLCRAAMLCATTPPAPAVPGDVAKDAARYRHIRNSVTGWRCVEDFANEDLDAALDAEIAATPQVKPPQPNTRDAGPAPFAGRAGGVSRNRED